MRLYICGRVCKRPDMYVIARHNPYFKFTSHVKRRSNPLVDDINLVVNVFHLNN